jgi:hypothetical protein
MMHVAGDDTRSPGGTVSGEIDNVGHVFGSQVSGRFVVFSAVFELVSQSCFWRWSGRVFFRFGLAVRVREEDLDIFAGQLREAFVAVPIRYAFQGLQEADDRFAFPGKCGGSHSHLWLFILFR